MLITKKAPNNSYVFNNNYKRYCTQRSQDAASVLEEAEPVYAEGLDGANEIQIQVDGADKAAQKVKRLSNGYGIEGGEVDVRGAERKREPAVQGESQTEARLDGQLFVVYDQEDALHPAFALLQEVPEGEWRLLPHLAVDPVERVALGHRGHGKVGVLGDAALGAVVKGDVALGAHLTHHERALKQEERFVELAQAEAKHADVSTHSKRVGQRGDPVNDLLVGVGDETLAYLMFALEQKVQDAADRWVREYGLLVQMHDPVIVVEQIDVVLERVLEGPWLVATVGLGAVGVGHHDLADPRVLGQVDRLVGDHLHDELVQAKVQTRVHVAVDVALDQIGIVAAGHDPDAHEGREERGAADGRLLREHVVDDQAAHVANAQRQRQKAEEPERVEYDGPEEAVGLDGVDGVALEVRVPDADAAGA